MAQRSVQYEAEDISDEDASDDVICGDEGYSESQSEGPDPSDTSEDVSVSEDEEGCITARPTSGPAKKREQGPRTKANKASKASHGRAKEKSSGSGGTRVKATRGLGKRAGMQSGGTTSGSPSVRRKFPKVRIGRGVSHKAGIALLSDSEDDSDMESERHAKDFRHLKLKEDYMHRYALRNVLPL